MEMIEIVDKVPFVLGLTPEEAASLRDRYFPEPFPFYREVPAHPASAGPFKISETLVTNAEYLDLVEAGAYEETALWKELLEEPALDGAKELGELTDQTGRPGPLTWSHGKPRPGTDDHPVSGVSWFEARAYCRFKGLRLPTEAEWELAARGTDGRLYPWGNEFDAERCAPGARWERASRPVTSLPRGRSAYGLLQMVGNVAQWCQDRYAPYPGSIQAGIYAVSDRVVRGDFYSGTAVSLRATVRSPQPPIARFPGLGFRCAADPA